MIFDTNDELMTILIGSDYLYGVQHVFNIVCAKPKSVLTFTDVKKTYTMENQVSCFCITIKSIARYDNFCLPEIGNNAVK